MRAQPGARRSGYAGLWNGLPKIAVGAPPEDGRANAEIAAMLAELFGLRSSGVTHVAGATARTKTYELALAPARVAERLAELELGHKQDAARDRPRGKQ